MGFYNLLMENEDWDSWPPAFSAVNIYRRKDGSLGAEKQPREGMR